MKYQVAEKFKSVQGEGVYAGTPMAFVRFVGCSVGKTICQHCDTDFDKTYPWRGGGEFTASELLDWAYPYPHICLTGGEPLNQELKPLFHRPGDTYQPMFHAETSGTIPIPECLGDRTGAKMGVPWSWVCVSPKPGFLEEVVLQADEVKVIVPGLGEINRDLCKFCGARKGAHTDIRDGVPGHEVKSSVPQDGLWHPFAPPDVRWPDISDALRWSHDGKIVFLQPRNAKFDVDKQNLLYVQDLIRDYPQLRLSVQLHKILKVQ